MRKYKNLEEIEMDLKILKLQARLEREKINLDLIRLKKQTTPQALVKSLLTQKRSGALLFRMVRGLLRRRR